jgi:hypothetical protein
MSTVLSIKNHALKINIILHIDTIYPESRVRIGDLYMLDSVYIGDFHNLYQLDQHDCLLI